MQTGSEQGRRHKEAGKLTAGVQSITATQCLELPQPLREGVNEALCALLRYLGDLSVMAIKAHESVDLAAVPLVSVKEKMVRDTTISCPGRFTRS